MLNEFQSRGKSNLHKPKTFLRKTTYFIFFFLLGHLVAVEQPNTHQVVGILTLEDVLQEILEKVSEEEE